MLSQTLIDRYRCPQEVGAYIPPGELSSDAGYFRFGNDLICFGQCASWVPLSSPEGPLHDTAADVCIEGQLARLPFDPEQIIDNFRLERYFSHSNRTSLKSSAARRAYYAVRPVLPVSVRKHFQRAYLLGRQNSPFPRWPVDCSTETLLERILAINLKAQGATTAPFIWFWPRGASACAVITHDVETSAGRDFCPRLMDIDDEFEMKASFQIVPEGRYLVPEAFLETIRKRGFEVDIQDLNHDGHLYRSEADFLRRAAAINQYARQYNAVGFRSAVLYRNPNWFHALAFNYDMSIPNMAHMDPQAGGCCTVFPYFIGDILEIPVTMTQDYTLFHILRQYSIELWKTQIDLIRHRHGLMSVIVHPDYLLGDLPQKIYRGLLRHLSRLRTEANIWVALPREVDEWWRARSQMRLVQGAGGWHIEGPRSEDACLAYAQVDNDQITYRMETSVPA